MLYVMTLHVDVPGSLFTVMEFPTTLFLTSKPFYNLPGILASALTGNQRRQSWKYMSSRRVARDHVVL